MYFCTGFLQEMEIIERCIKTQTTNLMFSLDHCNFNWLAIPPKMSIEGIKLQIKTVYSVRHVNGQDFHPGNGIAVED